MYGAILGQTPVPTGLISLWYGNIENIPSGWVLCNGQNGTPDLRDKFIVGAGNSYNVGDTGGANTVTLTSDQMPSHNHSLNAITTSQSGNHGHLIQAEKRGRFWGIRVGAGEIGGVDGFGLTSLPDTDVTAIENGNHTHTVTGTTSSVGNTQAHENRPPYYALCYIMKL